MENPRFQSLIDLYYRNAKHSGSKLAFLSTPPLFNETLTWEKVWLLAIALSEQLKKQGIKKGDRVGIFAHSSWRWEVCQLAIFLSQSVVVGIDPNETEKNLSSIYDQTQMKFVFCEKPHLIEKWNRASKEKALVLQLNTILEDLRNIMLPEFLDYDSKWVHNSDPAIIVFTSGTTSEPKGIEYSHGKVLFAVDLLVDLFVSRSEGSRTICWLPLANLFQRMMNYYSIHSQGTIYFIENPIEVMEYLPRVRPHVFVSVPRFYEKIFDRVQAQLNQLNPLLKGFIKIGLYLSVLGKNLRKNNSFIPKQEYELWIWDFIFFRRVRSLFGGEIDFLISGSAPLRKEIHLFFNAVGLPILEAYGTSENTLPVAANLIDQNKLVDFEPVQVNRLLYQGTRAKRVKRNCRQPL